MKALSSSSSSAAEKSWRRVQGSCKARLWPCCGFRPQCPDIGRTPFRHCQHVQPSRKSRAFSVARVVCFSYVASPVLAGFCRRSHRSHTTELPSPQFPDTLKIGTRRSFIHCGRRRRRKAEQFRSEDHTRLGLRAPSTLSGRESPWGSCRVGIEISHFSHLIPG